MKRIKRIIATALSLSLAATLCQPLLQIKTGAEELKMDIVINGKKASTAENTRYRGAGMVSGNNSSRLLLDYKAENPDAYWEIMNYMFSDKGIGINHLKVEMGSDINSSSGTEPSVMRYEDEEADVTRGAAYQIAADAKSINPDLTLDMLWWSEPLWVTNADDSYAARYKWYKETLDACYETYGIEFEYVSTTKNERATDADWIKYVSSHLKSETDCPYDYSKIKIVASDEVCAWGISDLMLEDEELLNAVDVMGSHYTSWSSDNTKKLINEYGKEAWFSEASSPMSYSKGTYRFDGTGSGMSDINGVLDIANRIITMYPGGMMTLYEYQPVVSAYYDGVTYCHKQLITACDPWSGYYELDSGFFMSLHFSQFMKKGWTFVDEACKGDGVAGGDGHAIVDAQYSFMTASDPDTGDYSTVITNTTASDITYNFKVSNLDKAGESVDIWETRGPDGGEYNENHFKKIDTITPAQSGDEYTYSVTVKPYSMVSVSTVEVDSEGYENMPIEDKQILSLPYSDDYEYKGYSEDYLSSRGNAPRYTTDQGGAFEVQNIDGNNVLMQMITPDIKATEWGGTPEPTTNFGDDRWFNYTLSIDTKFTSSDNPEENFVGAGLRYILASNGISGYWVKLFESGKVQLMRGKDPQAEGNIADFDSSAWNNIKISAVNDKVSIFVNEALVAEYTETDRTVLSAGRGAIYSSYNTNMFDNLKIEAVDDVYPCITRIDNTDLCVDYSDTGWTHETMCGFRNYRRTLSTGEAGASTNFTFTGTGFGLGGESKNGATVTIKIDGEVITENAALPASRSRELMFTKYGLEDKEHTVEITIIDGSFGFDSLEVTNSMMFTDKAEKETTVEAKAKKNSKLPYIAAGAGIAVLAGVGAVIGIKAKKKKSKK